MTWKFSFGSLSNESVEQSRATDGWHHIFLACCFAIFGACVCGFDIPFGSILIRYCIVIVALVTFQLVASELTIDRQEILGTGVEGCSDCSQYPIDC